MHLVCTAFREPHHSAIAPGPSAVDKNKDTYIKLVIRVFFGSLNTLTQTFFCTVDELLHKAGRGDVLYRRVDASRSREREREVRIPPGAAPPVALRPSSPRGARSRSRP